MRRALLLAPFLLAGSLAAQQPATPPLTLQANTPAVTEANRLMHINHFAEAEARLRTELAAHPRDADALYALAYTLVRQNHPADALQQYTAAAKLRTPSSTDLVRVGQAYVLLHDDADADKWTLQAIRADPKNSQAWYDLGRIRYTDQRFTEAETCFRQVLKLTPHNVKAGDNLGLALEGQNRTEDAINAYREAIAWQNAGPPQDRSEQPLLNLAIVLLHRGDTTAAAPLLSQAESISPHDPRIHEQLGHLYLQQSRWPDAARVLEQAIAEDPKSSGLHFLLGQAYHHQGRAEAAQAQFTLAANLAQPAPNPASKP